MKNKKGDIGLGWEETAGVVFAAIVFIFLFLFVGRQADSALVQEQILSKEICLAASSMQAGGILEIGHDKGVTIEKKGFGVVVKGFKGSFGYFYPCYLDNAEIAERGAKTYVEAK